MNDERIEQMSERIERIRELTETVTPLKNIITTKDNNHVDFKLESGSLVAEKESHSLYTKMLCFFKPKTVYPKHQHNEYEYIIILSGTVHIDLGDGMILYEEHAVICIPPETLHAVYTDDEATVIVITIPASGDY